MLNTFRNGKLRAGAFITSPAFFASVVFIASCSRPAVTATQKVFASPEDAGAAFLEAAKSGDREAFFAIFTPEAKDVLFSGDTVKDRATMEAFVAGYTAMHRWNEIKVGGQMLYIGADNFIFPIPLGRNPSGQWYFDMAAGKDEILARRIGRNELAAIAASAAVAAAEREYFDQPHDGDSPQHYTQKFSSDSGKQDGLYWAVADGQPPSPLGAVGDFAKNPQPFNGYYFRILTKQGDKASGGAKDYLVNGKLTGGFAILAYPAKYRDSGIMTFITGTDGIVYQKDLGGSTPEASAALMEYNPGNGWRAAL